MVASDAAMQTGLPPKVEACAPGFQFITFARAMMALSGMPEAIPFAVQMMSGSIPAWSDAHHLPVRPMPDCTSSATSMMPCLRQMRCETLQEFRRRGQVAAFTLNRLDENCGDFVGIDAALETVRSRDTTGNRPDAFSGRMPYVPR